jgi:endo-1,4-beta-xylanase
MEITRRDGLTMALGMVVAGCAEASSALPAAATPPAPSQLPTSLGALARAKGMRFGSTVGAGSAGSGSYRNPDYAELLTTECGLIVPENELKWQAVRPSADRFDFEAFDGIIKFAETNGIATRGHTLLWHRPEWMPAWEETHDFGANPVAEAERLIKTHVNTVCARYKGRINAYDVVNESVLPEDGSLSQTALSKAIGGTETLLDLAFHTAREAAPGAQLVYNDYMSWEPGNEKHRAGVLKLLSGFKARGVPVDALGIQSHIRIDSYDPRTGTGPHDERAWRKFIDEVVSMGYGLVITEFDVNDQALPADIATRDQSVADYAKAYLDLMFSYPQLKDMLVWGMCDSFSWLQNFQPLRGDGEIKRPCPYDGGFKAKPLRAAITAALLNRPI